MGDAVTGVGDVPDLGRGGLRRLVVRDEVLQGITDLIGADGDVCHGIFLVGFPGPFGSERVMLPDSAVPVVDLGGAASTVRSAGELEPELGESRVDTVPSMTSPPICTRTPPTTVGSTTWLMLMSLPYRSERPRATRADWPSESGGGGDDRRDELAGLLGHDARGVADELTDAAAAGLLHQGRHDRDRLLRRPWLPRSRSTSAPFCSGLPSLVPSASSRPASERTAVSKANSSDSIDESGPAVAATARMPASSMPASRSCCEDQREPATAVRTARVASDCPAKTRSMTTFLPAASAVGSDSSPSSCGAPAIARPEARISAPATRSALGPRSDEHRPAWTRVLLW